MLRVREAHFLLFGRCGSKYVTDESIDTFFTYTIGFYLDDTAVITPDPDPDVRPTRQRDPCLQRRRQRRQYGARRNRDEKGLSQHAKLAFLRWRRCTGDTSG
jgi:hypothetical protein